MKKYDELPGFKLAGEYTDPDIGITLPVYEMPMETAESWNAKADRLNKRRAECVRNMG
ncbi:hypothetical protein [Anaerotruncus rubiinfantis]|uniref:hypothetical protein n=1 Tax=Anaerotruncus rubiinfantis TaxID=1720200 RepID=UPI00189B5574|nr:hypothetical protein [Anaerotruncus rubiinfantis]